jgi:hypothetical protein
MITNSLEFPCVEASRCHLTEKENGLRLLLVKIPKNKRVGLDEDLYRLEFTRLRNRNTEWYVHLDSTVTEEGISMRTVRFRHVETGKYLHSSADGKVGTQDFPSHWTTWLMEPVESSSSSSSISSAARPQSPQELFPMSRNNRSHSRSWDAAGSNSPTRTKGPAGSPRSSSFPDNTFSVYYSLLPKAFAPRKLAYTTRESEDGGVLEPITTASGDAAVWELEFTSGELCFLSNPILHTQIRCSVFGQLTLSSVFQGWEVFRFIEVGYGNVAISSWTHSHKYLSSDPDGRVVTSENRLGHWEKWKLEKTENGVHIISVAHPDRYLTVGKDEDHDALQTTTRQSDFNKWHIDAAHCNIYYLSSVGAALQSNNNKTLHVSSRPRGPFLSKHKRDWEEWKLNRTIHGDITLWSKAHDKFLGCNSQGELHTTSTKGDWSLWEMEESPHGGVYLKSKAHQRTLSVQNTNVLCTTRDSFTEAETFRLEPRLPATISGPRLAALGVAGVVGVALTIAMPYAILGIMEAAGVAATELSVLAGISAEALAGAGGGALLGAGVVGTTAAVVKDSVDDRSLSPSAEVKDDLIGVQRPISAWRNW